MFVRMATSQVPVSASCDTSSETGSSQQQAGTRMLPLLYIQGAPGIRVGSSNAASMPISTTSTGTQVCPALYH